MTISKVLSNFAKDSGNVDVLNNPKKYFGPNADKLLEFWNKLDTLTEDQLKVIEGHFLSFYHNQESEWFKATDEAIKASDETIGGKFSVEAAWFAENVYGYTAYWATLEIIGGIKNPVFLKMFDNL